MDIYKLISILVIILSLTSCKKGEEQLKGMDFTKYSNTDMPLQDASKQNSIPVVSVGSSCDAKKGMVIIKNDNILVSTGEVTFEVPNEVTFDVPNEMIVGKPYTAKVVVNPNPLKIRTTKPGLKISVGTEIRATLTDSTIFEIVAQSTEIKCVDEHLNITEWNWQVIPKRTGIGQLKLQLSIIMGDKIMASKDLPVYTELVTIQSNASNTFWYWVKINWAELLAFLISSGIILYIIIMWYKDRKQDNPKKEKEVII
jgi:hypothetical protein